MAENISASGLSLGQLQLSYSRGGVHGLSNVRPELPVTDILRRVALGTRMVIRAKASLKFLSDVEDMTK